MTSLARFYDDSGYEEKETHERYLEWSGTASHPFHFVTARALGLYSTNAGALFSRAGKSLINDFMDGCQNPLKPKKYISFIAWVLGQPS